MNTKSHRCLPVALFLIVACKKEPIDLCGPDEVRPTRNANALAYRSPPPDEPPLQYIVTLDTPDVDHGKQILEDAGFYELQPIVSDLKRNKSVFVTDDNPEAIQQLFAHESLLNIEPNHHLHALEDAGSDIQCIPLTEEVIPFGVTRLQADKVWSITEGEGVIIAVVDSGVDADHPDIAGNLFGGSCARLDCGLSNDYTDESGHGTHVAGIALAVENEVGIRGVAPKAKLYAVKVLDGTGTGSVADIVLGLRKVKKLAEDHPNTPIVLNMSFGGGESEAIADAIDDIAELDVVLVAAGGNSGDGNSETVEAMDTPAILTPVIAVAAINESDDIAYFSTNNAKIELSANGVNVFSDFPDDSTTYLSGTSMASPYIAGVAALIRSAYPELSAECVRAILVNNAENLGDDNGRDIAYGFGIPQLKLIMSNNVVLPHSTCRL
jgi:subtilisin family serine protease